MYNSGAVLVIVIVVVLILIVHYRMGRHTRAKKALDSHYRDKKLYFDLLGSQALNKAVGLALFVTVVISLITSYQKDSPAKESPSVITPAIEQQEEKNVTYEGNRRVVRKPPKWDKDEGR